LLVAGGPGGPYGITYPNYHPGGPLYPSLAGGNYLSMAPAQLTTPRHLLLQHGSLPRGKVGWGRGVVLTFYTYRILNQILWNIKLLHQADADDHILSLLKRNDIPVQGPNQWVGNLFLFFVTIQNLRVGGRGHMAKVRYGPWTHLLKRLLNQICKCPNLFVFIPCNFLVFQ
jgi:hypothetical protein